MIIGNVKHKIGWNHVNNIKLLIDNIYNNTHVLNVILIYVIIVLRLIK
jgi:hypothetical protein